MSDKPTCKTCHWWGSPRDKQPSARRCDSPLLFRTGEEREPNVYDENHVLAGTEAAVTDGSGFTASLWTTADFGCVNHEPAKCHFCGKAGGVLERNCRGNWLCYDCATD